MARRRTTRARRPLTRRRTRTDPTVIALLAADVLLAFGLARTSGTWLPVILAAVAVAAGFALTTGWQRLQARRW